MTQHKPSWYTEHHRGLADAEAARKRWLIDTGQWPYQRESSRFDSIGSSPWEKRVLAALLLLLMMQLAWG